MNKHTHSWLAAAAATMLLAGGAWAQSQGGENPAPSGSSLDCANGTVSTSGTESARGPSMKRTHKASAHAGAKKASGDRYTLHASFPQCSAKNDRSARAECVRTAWESRHGMPGERTTMASASSRRPC